MIGASAAPDRLGLSDTCAAARHLRDAHKTLGTVNYKSEKTIYYFYYMPTLSDVWRVFAFIGDKAVHRCSAQDAAELQTICSAPSAPTVSAGLVAPLAR